MANKIYLHGYIGQDPELKMTPSGMAVCRFSLATTEKWKDKTSGEKKEKTEWHRIVVWNKLAEVVEKTLKKGAEIALWGKVQYGSYPHKDHADIKIPTTDIIMETFEFCGRRGDGGNRDDGRPDPEPTGRDAMSDRAPASQEYYGGQEEDIPF
jgi:single-strand DNA-binding protein